MATDPQTGSMKPVTLYPKNMKNVGNPGNITTVQYHPRGVPGSNPSGIRLANPSPATTLNTKS